MYVYGSFVHQKCSNYTLANVLFGLCRFMWIIDPLVIRHNPHLGTPKRPFTPKMLWAREHTRIPSLDVSTFGLTFELFNDCGGVSSLLFFFLFLLSFSSLFFLLLLWNVTICYNFSFYISSPTTITFGNGSGGSGWCCHCCSYKWMMEHNKEER
jgi:hypothetical protein